MTLQKLIDAVEAGTIHQSDLDAFIPVFGMTTAANDAHMAYRGSLDAAKALHDALLPGWSCALNTNGIAQVISPNGDRFTGTKTDAPARAWLLAVLRALQAEAGE